MLPNELKMEYLSIQQMLWGMIGIEIVPQCKQMNGRHFLSGDLYFLVERGE